MQAVIKEIKEEQTYKQLPFHTKVNNFWMLRKRRFAYLVILGLVFWYDLPNRFVNWVVNKRVTWLAAY